MTLTTVGYGDMGATTAGTRLFTTFFVLFGIGFIGVALGIVATKFLDFEENATKLLAKALDDVVDDVQDTVKIQVQKVASEHRYGSCEMTPSAPRLDPPSSR